MITSLTIVLPPDQRDAFSSLCKKHGITPKDAVRGMILGSLLDDEDVWAVRVQQARFERLVGHHPAWVDFVVGEACE